MGISSFDDLAAHVGCDLSVVTYGKSPTEIANVAIECETHGEVLVDYDNPYVYSAEHVKLCNAWNGYQGNDHTPCPGWPHNE